ncbi:MAG: hypothetical protein IJZ51_00855 [Ruminiclostridium sp.]|nr:hypothetical protein [Ruminiclostridium sp.]
MLNKKKLLRKKSVAIITIVSIIAFTSLISIFPVENAFIRFDTPEQAFSYVETGKFDYVVEGESSSMVVYKKDSNTYSQIFLLKDEKGYMLNSFYGYTLTDRMLDGNYALDIFKVKNTDDYYITGVLVSDTSNVELKSDTRDVKYDIRYNENNNFFSAYIKEYADDIYLVCDGEKVEIGG